MSRPRRWVGTVAILAAVAAGCTGPDSDPPPPDRPSPSPSLSYDEAVGRVPLDGTARVPLHWQLPPPAPRENDEDRDAVLTGRRYAALMWHLASLEEPGEAAKLASYLAFKEVASKAVETYGRPGREGDPEVGPLWVWVLGQPSAAGDSAVLDLCVDVGWHAPRDDVVGLPRPAGQRAELRQVIVNQILVDGVPRWRVFAYDSDARDRLGGRYGTQCAQWATHTPPPQERPKPA